MTPDRYTLDASDWPVIINDTHNDDAVVATFDETNDPGLAVVNASNVVEALNTLHRNGGVVIDTAAAVTAMRPALERAAVLLSLWDTGHPGLEHVSGQHADHIRNLLRVIDGGAR